MIGIIGAMASEVNGLKAQMKELDIQKIGTTNFYHGIIFGKEVVVAKCGIGKVNASMCTQNMIHAYKPSLIINTGCAAGVGDGIRVGDIVLASKAVQHDLDYGPLPDARGYLDGIDRVYIDADKENTETIAAIAESIGVHTRIGVVATGDQFLCDPVKKEEIKSIFNADAVEMEGGSIAHTACANGVPFVILRSISDNGDEGASVSYEEFEKEVNKINIEILKRYLEGQQ